ncbi:hypothetical protein [Bordetella bronchialis]|uniref:hypothetical protein n=1 Tax=Bordetella bronchialis TaxID=463025 RepID=UPI000B2E0809|nr:hypothetical protein [Bordetella bronchialis]
MTMQVTSPSLPAGIAALDASVLQDHRGQEADKAASTDAAVSFTAVLSTYDAGASEETR